MTLEGSGFRLTGLSLPTTGPAEGTPLEASGAEDTEQPSSDLDMEVGMHCTTAVQSPCMMLLAPIVLEQSATLPPCISKEKRYLLYCMQPAVGFGWGPIDLPAARKLIQLSPFLADGAHQIILDMKFPQLHDYTLVSSA